MNLSPFYKQLIQRWFSKKLVVFLIATILLIYHYINSEQWYLLAIAWVGGQHAHDIIMNWKNSSNNQLTTPEETKS